MSAFTHDYSQTFTYKFMLARKPDRVVHTFEQALQRIRDVHRLSGGLKQIIYLVGWQYDGHDSKYPAWFAGNERLKRPQDPDALTSLRWLMGAAREFNCSVSLHINMDDAYRTSPLWEEYLERDLIVRHPDGRLLEAGVWDGEMSYHICKPREWAAGLAQRRIDRLLELLPIRESGTIHIDAFRPQDEMEHADISYEQELQTVKDIVAYFRGRGIDATTEFLACHELVGEHPMVYHFNASEETRLKYPPSLICGGGSGWNKRRATLRTKEAWYGGFTLPEGGCLYEEAWGESVDRGGDIAFFAEQFYLKPLPWHFLNRHRAEKFWQTRELYTVEFADEVVSQVRVADRHLTIREDGRLVRDGDDLFIPAAWLGDACIAFSRKGGAREWRAPFAWSDARSLEARRLWPETEPAWHPIASENGSVRVALLPGEALLVRPVR